MHKKYKRVQFKILKLNNAHGLDYYNSFRANNCSIIVNDVETNFRETSWLSFQYKRFKSTEEYDLIYSSKKDFKDSDMVNI